MMQIYDTTRKYEATLKSIPAFSAEKRVVGGNYALDFEITRREVDDLEAILETWLGYYIALRVDELAFAGQIIEIKYARDVTKFARTESKTLGGQRNSVDDGEPAFFNAVKVAYEDGETAWETSSSVSTYGRRELAVEKMRTESGAIERQNQLLEIYGQPTTWQTGSINANEPMLWVTVAGELSKGNWEYAVIDDNQTYTVSGLIEMLIGQSSHLEIGYIAPHGAEAIHSFTSSTTIWGAISKVAAQTNNGQPYELYNIGNKVYFVPLTNAPSFYISAEGLSDTPHGELIGDAQVAPGVWRDLTKPAQTNRGAFLAQTRDFLQRSVRYRYQNGVLRASLGDKQSFFVSSSKGVTE